VGARPPLDEGTGEGITLSSPSKLLRPSLPPHAPLHTRSHRSARPYRPVGPLPGLQGPLAAVGPHQQKGGFFCCIAAERGRPPNAAEQPRSPPATPQPTPISPIKRDPPRRDPHRRWLVSGVCKPLSGTLQIGGFVGVFQFRGSGRPLPLSLRNNGRARHRFSLSLSSRLVTARPRSRAPAPPHRPRFVEISYPLAASSCSARSTSAADAAPWTLTLRSAPFANRATSRASAPGASRTRMGSRGLAA